jgi:hypothetical protein
MHSEAEFLFLGKQMSLYDQYVQKKGTQQINLYNRLSTRSKYVSFFGIYYRQIRCICVKKLHNVDDSLL